MPNEEQDDLLPQANKVGRWLKTEEAFIAANYKTMSAGDIAGQLKRNVVTVKKYIDEKFSGGQQAVQALSGNYEFDIQKSPMWKEIQSHFTKDELDTFLYHFANICLQFQYNILPTERMQIIDAVRVEILMDRALKKCGETQQEVRDIEIMIKAEEETGDDDDPNRKARIINLKQLKLTANQSISNFNKEYKELLDKKTSLLRELKATRAERIKRIESNSETMGNWIAKMMSEPELRKQMGIEIEKMRLAKTVEYHRLSEYHTYLDGRIEQPILNSDNIKEDNV